MTSKKAPDESGQLLSQGAGEWGRQEAVAHLFKVIYLRDDVTSSGLACGEGAAYDLATSTRLVATGLCRIADDEPEPETLEAAVRVYKQPRQTERWEMPMVGPRWPGWYK